MSVRILCFAGSTRSGSLNKKLARVAAHAAEAAGAEVTLIDLHDFPLPLYDGDLEQTSGIPGEAVALKTLMKAHDAFLLACPEYNGSITAVLKNAIDWASRRDGDEAPLECFRGKSVALTSASPGRLGGLRGLVHVRAILGGLGCIVLPGQLAVGMAAKAFSESGELADGADAERLQVLAAELVRVSGRLQDPA